MSSVPDARTPEILVVDYDVTRLSTVRVLLEAEDYAVVVARDSATALAGPTATTGVLVLADEMHLGPTRRLVGTLRRRIPALQLVLLASARSGQLSRESLERLGVHGYVREADGPDRIVEVVAAAVRSHVALAQAQASDRLKTELLASVSHEFRSPLHIILGYLELAREGALGACSDPLRDALDKIQWNTGQLLELVEEFLDLAKLESGTVTVERVDVATLVRTLVADNELLLHDRPIVLRAQVTGPLPPVLADGAKIRVILQNLLTNALKFTERGEILVTAQSPRPAEVAIHVRDTGPGIPADARERVFDLFAQLQPGDMRRRGIGLGLALARRFARAMGGELTLASALHAGSTFTLTLPAVDVAADEPGAAADDGGPHSAR